MKINIKDMYVSAPLLLIAFIGLSMCLYATRTNGVGMTPDSAYYIGGARFISEGNGYSMFDKYSNKITPEVHFPPLVSFILASVGLFKVDPQISIRFLNAILFTFNIFLVGFIVYRLTNSRISSFFGSFMMMTSFDMLFLHSYAFSEPVFLCIFIVFMYLLSQYIDSQKRYYLFVSSIFAGLAFLSRYAGIVLFPFGCLAVLLFQEKRLGDRLKDALLFCSLGSILMFLWIIRNIFLAGNATNRHFGFHPPSLWHLKELINTAIKWLFHWKSLGFFWGGFLLFAIAVIILINVKILRNGQVLKLFAQRNIPIFVKLGGLFAMLYFLFITVSITLFGHNTPLNFRILSPVYIVSLIISIYFIHEVYKKRSMLGVAPVIKILYSTALILFCLVQLTQAYLFIENDDEVIGYSNPRWRESKIIKAVKNMPEGKLIYSNVASGLYILAERPAICLPEVVDQTFNNSVDYINKLKDVKNGLIKNDGVVVIMRFSDGNRKEFEIPEDVLIKELSLELLLEDSSGAIYKVRS